MDMQTCFTVVADCDVADCTQNFALLLDLDLLVGLFVEIEPTDGRLLERADGRQRSRRDAGLVRKLRERGKGVFSGVEDDDAGFGSRVSSYPGALHDLRPRWIWRPSLTSSMILPQKASRSPGLRDVITP